MRAARLLKLLLLLQARGRMTTSALASELEVARRTILRDVDALTEAGVPVIVFRGQQGGVELGFNYRARLTGLAADETEALAVLLNRPSPELAALGLADAGARARAKIVETLPEAARELAALASARFRFDALADTRPDERLAALAEAIREARIVWVRRHGEPPRELHPVALAWGAEGCRVLDARADFPPLRLSDRDPLHVSARRFAKPA
jgi:predicted DNA-binding transcriptional regulator YafY